MERLETDLVTSGTDAHMLEATIRILAANASIETTPKQATKVRSFADILPEATKVFIAFIPGDTADAMIATAHRLVDEGMVPVPHMPARNMTSETMFHEFVEGMAKIGVDHALMIAGGLNPPAGPYHASTQLLSSGALEQAGYRTLFVAGHPEGSPDISDQDIQAALTEKNAFAAESGLELKIATQFSFDAKVVIDWEKRIAAQGNRLPIRIGLAGPASITSLMRYATMCGVKASTSFLSKTGSKALKLVGSRTPDDVLTRLARHRVEMPTTSIEGIHLYPFGGFEKTTQWLGAVRRGEFSMNRDFQGFTAQT